MALNKVGLYMLLTAFFTAGWVSTAEAYILTGTVTNNSGKTGRTYLFVNDSDGYGTSINSAGTFSISGVPSGTYTITAVMDSRGDGKLFATDPIGVSTSFTVASADKSGIAVTLNNPTAPTPPTPSWLKVYPGEGSASAFWDIKANNNPHLPIADHYSLYWSTSSSVSPINTSGGGSRLGMPHPGYAPIFLTGLTNGTSLYFVVTALVNGVEGAPSPVYGPVTIGPPTTAGVTVQGNVSLFGFTPTGPLCVGLFGGDVFQTKCISSPTSSQPFQFNNVADNYYQVFSSVDMNNNGVDDPGDISVGGLPSLTPLVLVQGSPVSGVTITLVNSGGDAAVYTEYEYPSSYSLLFEGKNNSKLITNMTVMSGPNLAQPIDVPWDDGYFYSDSLNLPGRPSIGDTYIMSLRYSDGTTDAPSSAITDILDGYSTPVSPSGSTSGLSPLMTWSQPSSPPSQVPFFYNIRVFDASGTAVWDYKIPNNRTYAVYNEDGTAILLIGGSQYHWRVRIEDQHGNRGIGPNVYFTPTVATSQQLAVLSRNPASGVAIAVNTNDKNGLGNGNSPFTRFYDAGTTLILTAPSTTAGNSFNSWSGCDSVNGSECTVSVSADRIVTATYSFLPPAPSGISASAGTGQATIKWNSVPGATSYNLYYSTTPGVTTSTGTKVSNVTSPYIQSSLTNSTSYYFVVTAVNANGEGALSAEVGAVPGMPSAYTKADLTGVWNSNNLASRPTAPWWQRVTIGVDATGNFAGSILGSDGTSVSSQGMFNISTNGTITMNGNSSFQCNMDAGRAVFVCTNTWPSGNPATAEMDIFTKKAASYSQADLTGDWRLNQIATGSSQGNRHWLQGSLSLNSSGTGTVNYNSDNQTYGALPITITTDANGKITATILSSSTTYTYPDCSLDAGKTVIVCVNTDTEHDESLLTIYAKKASSYSQSDMTGTWALNTFADGQGSPWWERGIVTVGATGSLSGSLEVYGTTTPDNVSGTISLSSSGTATPPFKPLTRCSMDAGKTIMVCTGDWTASQLTSEMSVWTKIGSVPQYIPAPSPILWYKTGSGMVYDMTTDGTTVTGGTVVWTEPNTAWSIVGKGDFDGDGVLDYIWRNSSTGQVYLMFMTSTTSVKSGAVVWIEPDQNWKIVATGDLNGDGKTDLIWWNSSTGMVFGLLINGSSSPTGAVIWTEPDVTHWRIVAAGDLNGDGKADLIWWNSSTGMVFGMLMNGTTVTSSGVIWTEPGVANWRIVGIGDLNGDGKADLIWRSRTTGQVFAMLMNGLAVSSSGVFWTEPDLNWEIVSIGNYTNDAKADLLWRHKTTGMVYLLPMNGLTPSGGSVLWTEPDMTWRIESETEWRNNVYGVGVTTP